MPRETSLTHLQDALEAQAEVLERLLRKWFLKCERERERKGAAKKECSEMSAQMEASPPMKESRSLMIS